MDDQPGSGRSPANARRIYIFEAFELDAERLVLSCRGKAVPATYRLLSTLVYLVEHSGRTLSKAEMLAALWPDRTVEEASLSQAISGLRKTLAEHGSAGLITTVSGRGYRFAGEVRRKTSIVEPLPSPAAIQSMPAGKGRGRRARGYLTTAGVACALSLIALVMWRLQASSSRLTGERTGIVIADPQDFIGDASLAHVAVQVLRADLSQSPVFQVASETEVGEALALMEQPRQAPLPVSEARAVCARTNGGAVVVASLSKVQTRYVLTLSATSCVDGRLLVDEKAEADDRGVAVRRLSDLTARMRRQLGEMRASIARYDVPLAPERTSSFDALRAYSEAELLMRSGRRLEAIPLYRHATELDPDFAMAYFGLSQAYYEFFQTANDAAAISQAYKRLSLVSERDALLIREHYDSVVSHDLDAARESMELLTRLYPRDAGAWLALAELRYRLADYPGAAAAGEQGLKLDPANSGAYTTLARALNHLQRTAQAEQLDARALTAVPETDQIRQQRIAWRFMQGDPAGGRKLVASAAGTPFEREALLEASNLAFADGRVEEATRLVAQADALGRAKRLDPDYTRAAESFMEVGLEARARSALAKVPPAVWSGQDDYLAARLDPPAQARTLLMRDLADRPRDTLLNGAFAPQARAALLLREGRAREAADLLDGVGRFTFHDLATPYLRGTALLAAKDGVRAAAAFRSVLVQTGFSWDPQYELAHLGLARALRLQGDFAESRREYLAFLGAWKDADPELPDLRQARAEYTALASPGAGEALAHRVRTADAAGQGSPTLRTRNAADRGVWPAFKATAMEGKPRAQTAGRASCA